jgi:hypothetical protein
MECDLQKHLDAILRDHSHLEIDLSINTHEFNFILDEDCLVFEYV